MTATKQELLAQVTELRARLQAAEAEGELIQEILQHEEQAIAICDRSGVIIRASRGLHELCGQNPLLLPFHLVFPLKTPDNKTFLLSPLFQGKSLRNPEADFRRPDGKKIHVLLNAGPLRARDGEINGFVATLTDISERLQTEAEKEKLLEKLRVHEEELQVVNEELRVANEELQVHVEELRVQAEELQSAYEEINKVHEALRQSQGDLRRAQQISQIGGWRLDVRRDDLSWCRETRRIFGVSAETPLNYKTFLDTVHPEDREYVNRKWEAALKGEPYDLEHRIVVDGTIKWLRELAELEFDSQGHLLGAFGTVQDITARKQAEAALHLSHQRLDLLAASAGRLLASADPQEVVDDICLKVMQFLDCDVFFNFLRDESADRLHLNAWAGIPAEEAARIEWLDYGAAVCGCAARDGCRIVAEDILHTPDPRTDLVKSYGIQAYACQPLLVGGKPLGTLSFGTRKKPHFNDEELALMQAVADQVAVAIERQQFEKELFDLQEKERAKAEELQAVLDAVPIPIFMSRDPSGRTIKGNPAAYKALQLPSGTNLSKAAPDEAPSYKPMQKDRELRLEELPMQRALRGQWVQDLEYDLVWPDGSRRHVLANAVPLLDDAGQPRGAVGAMMDLTELNQAQERLRQARDELEVRVQERTQVLRFTVAQLQEEVVERLQAEAELTKQSELVQDLYNRAPCGYHSLDAEGFFVRINDTELEWLGYSREEVVRRMHFEDLLTPDSLKAFRQSFLELKQKGQVGDLEFELRRKNGTVFPVLLNATAVTDEAGNFLLCRSTLFDITERQKAEQSLRESEERLRFLASQLLTAQEQERKRLAGELHDELGHALLTLKLSLGSISRQMPPELEKVQHLLQDQLEYINHVIEEVRRLYQDLSPGDLEDLGLTRALQNLVEEFGSHQPDIAWQVALPDLQGQLSLPAQTIVYRLVQEALTNIGKHAAATRVSVTAREENRHLHLVIEDDGQGFDLLEVEQDPHRGMGLAAMRERLYIVGGSLEIRSRKGAGTKLTFMIQTE